MINALQASVLAQICIFIAILYVGHYLIVVGRAVLEVAKAIIGLENCIRETAKEFTPKTATQRELEWMRDVSFGEPKD
jgi:hypothetical protein